MVIAILIVDRALTSNICVSTEYWLLKISFLFYLIPNSSTSVKQFKTQECFLLLSCYSVFFFPYCQECQYTSVGFLPGSITFRFSPSNLCTSNSSRTEEMKLSLLSLSLMMLSNVLFTARKTFKCEFFSFSPRKALYPP